MFCPKCNNIVNDNSMFCPICGHKMQVGTKAVDDKKKVLIIGVVTSVIAVICLVLFNLGNISFNNPLNDTEYINNANEYSFAGYRIFIPKKYLANVQSNLFAVTDYTNTFSLEISDKISFKKVFKKPEILTDRLTANGMQVYSNTKEKYKNKDYILISSQKGNDNVLSVCTAVGKDSLGCANVLIVSSDYQVIVNDIVDIFAHAVK